MPDLAGRRVLVTGGAGFIGRAMVRRLLDAEADVVVADLNPCPVAGVSNVTGDLREPAQLEAAVTADLHGIVHLAALTSVLKSVQVPWEVYRTNVEMTSALLEHARLAGVSRFVAASTNAVVGDVGRTTMTEGLPLRPLTPYGATKAAAEMLMSAYAASYGMAACALRLTNVYGPGMGHKDSMVPRLLRATLSGDTVEIYGDGSQVRDFIHVDDVTAAFLLALTDELSGPVIVGYGRSYSVNELVAATRDVTGRDVATRNGPAKPGEMPAVIVDPSYAATLGWVPTVDLTAGLTTAWDYFRDLHEQGTSAAG